MGVSPEEVVAPPATKPSFFGLLDSANIVEMPESSRWESGFVFQPENCIASEVWVPCGGNDVMVIGLFIDATGGGFVVLYDGASVEVPFDVTPDGLVDSLVEVTGGVLQRDNIVVRGGPGNADAFTGLQPYYITIEVTNGFDLALFGVGESPTNPLTGGDGIGPFPLQLPGTELRPPDVKKDYDGEQTPIRFYPYVVEVPYTCSSWGYQENDYEGRALRQLEAGLGKAIEREFWTGERNPANPNLTFWTPNDDDHILNPGGAAAPVAVNVALGLALLEQALASCATGSQGMIHAAPVVVERMAQWYLVDNDDHFGGLILGTRSRGDIVVCGNGYPRTGPFGSPFPADDEAWVFATGMVDVRLGEPMIYPETFAHAFDRATNTVTYRGEQVAAATHDACCTFAVLVNFTEPLS